MAAKALKHKVFLMALSDFHQGHKKFIKHLNDKRLTLAEKKILQAWIFLKNNEFEKIFDHLSTLQVEDDFIQSQRQLLIGNALNNSSQCDLAVPHFLQALKLLKPFSVPRHEFSVLYDLFITYLNLKDDKGMSYCMAEIERLTYDKSVNLRHILQLKFQYALFHERLEEAENFLAKIDLEKAKMSEVAFMFHLISKYEFYIKKEDFDACETVLEEMKELRNFKNSANVIFMRTLLKHLLYRKVLYLYPSQFEGQPLLFYQLKVIQCLEESNLIQATKYWSELSKIAPRAFLEAFNYQGDKCIFSLCLNLYNEKAQEISVKLSHCENVDEKILKLLNSSSRPIPKEELYEKVYQESLDSKDDLGKLKKALSRVRSKYHLEIVYKKGCYSIAA